MQFCVHVTSTPLQTEKRHNQYCVTMNVEMEAKVKRQESCMTKWLQRLSSNTIIILTLAFRGFAHFTFTEALN